MNAVTTLQSYYPKNITHSYMIQMLCDNIRKLNKSRLQYHKKYHFFDRNNIKLLKLWFQTLYIFCGRKNGTKLTSIKIPFLFQKLHYWLYVTHCYGNFFKEFHNQHVLPGMCVCQVLLLQTCYPTNKKILSTTENICCFYAIAFITIYMYRLLQKVNNSICYTEHIKLLNVLEQSNIQSQDLSITVYNWCNSVVYVKFCQVCVKVMCQLPYHQWVHQSKLWWSWVCDWGSSVRPQHDLQALPVTLAETETNK